MRWLKGLIFLIIAIASLYIVLMWPHKDEYIEDKSIGGVSAKVSKSPYGLPAIWMYDINIQNISGRLDEPTEYNKSKEYSADKLLINLICWAVFLTLVTFGFKALSNVGNR